ncbi:unnamed protein product [Clonostachys byssicola]|uniref:Uncharacterized protein n=1 Tax=Clonostachys byssicola TaxID=160290 RepID=A0A9N9U3N9_9HYPO|nr:unnamed protein product [Clonostachys byssicola]
MVLEFPNSRNDWKLDAVGLLAVIGETTTETCVEPMTASYLCLLPRLIPAPQALIRPNRRIALASVSASIVGVYSGTTMSQLSYISNQIHPIAMLPTFGVRVLQIKHRQDPDALRRQTTNLEKMLNYIEPPLPMMKAKLISPHNILSVATTLLTLGLLLWAIIIEDGPATTAIVLLASATTIFCAASLWSPSAGPRSRFSFVPPGDVVIRTKEGSFLIVKCNEEVSRELYFGTDELRQAITTGFGLCVGIGTVVFMVAVILMGNSSWTMQAALAVTYLLLNAVYWFVALLPSTTHWEFPRYEWEDITPEDARDAEKVTDQENQREGYPSFTRSLWFAIRETKRTGWVSRSGAAPETDSWKVWLEEAERNAVNGNRSWNAVERKNQILNSARGDVE